MAYVVDRTCMVIARSRYGRRVVIESQAHCSERCIGTCIGVENSKKNKNAFQMHKRLSFIPHARNTHENSHRVRHWQVDIRD